MNNNTIAYHYQDENRKILFSKIKVEPSPENNAPKSYYWEHEENGIKIRNIDGCRKVLYRLPQLLLGLTHNQPIFLVEGEKDVDTLLSHLLIATTSLGSLEWRPEFTQILKDADVIILYDNDKTGLRRRDMLIQNLYGKVKRLRVIDLPGIEYSESHGKDITDWFEIGNTKEQLLELVNNTPDYVPSPQPQTGKLRAISVEEFFLLKIPDREMLLAPFLPSQGLVLLVAKRGVGKTFVALGIAYAIATGGTFLRWTAPKPKKALYIDGEMPAILMQERLQMIASMSTKKCNQDFLKLITPDLQEQVLPDLATQEGRSVLEEYIKDYDLIVLDNISCLFRSGSENESESWQQAQEWALDLRRRGKSVLFVHHAGKNGVQRGTSKREDILDSVIILKHPDDYKAEEGARFEVHFDKARSFTGADASSFQAYLKETNGVWTWELSDTPQEEQIIHIADMKKNGLTIKEICNETKLTKAQVEWRLAKAKEREIL